MNKKILGLALAATFSTGIAQAATYSESGSFGVQGSSNDVTMGTLAETITITGFDSALGTLTGVNVTAFGQLDSSGSSQNESVSSGRADVAIDMQSAWAVSSASTSGHIFTGPAFGFLSADSGAGFTMGTGDIFTYALSSGELSGLLSSVILADFIDLDVDFLFAGKAQTNINNSVASGTGFFTNSFATGSWGKIVIDYTYDDAVTPPVTVAEPASLALLGLGLGLMGVARRNKKA